MFILLDIDGVLNREDQWNRSYPLDDHCITAFANYARNVPDCKIILTSSWRLGFLAPMSKQNTPQVRTLERKFRDRGIRVSGRTGDLGSRAREVRLFVRKHPNEDYIIIDDEPEEYAKADDDIKSHIYVVNAATGFTDGDTAQIYGRSAFGYEMSKMFDGLKRKK